MFSKENQELRHAGVPKLERFFKILNEKFMTAKQDSFAYNISLSAEKRFEKFRVKYPSLLQKVQQKQIAPYLDVKTEFFSTINSKPLRKQLPN
jgi:hypothetical protein